MLCCGASKVFASTQKEQARDEPVRAAWLAVGVVVARAGGVHAMFGNEACDWQEPRVSWDSAVDYFTLTVNWLDGTTSKAVEPTSR